jgi:glycosyltransferase involved in cell wall biosynthesis
LESADDAYHACRRIDAVDRVAPRTSSLYLKARPPGFKLHSFYADFSTHAIPGWRVIAPRRTSRQGPEILRQVHVALHAYPVFWKLSNRIVPTLQAAAFPYTNRVDRLERNADLTYCANHVQTRSDRWVVDFEHIGALTGYYDPGLASRWLGRRLREASCRKILCWSNKALENAKRVLGKEFPSDKCHVIYPATSPPDSIEPRAFDGTIRICHVTTHRDSQLENISNFYVKGTRDVLLLLKMMSRVSPKLVKKMTVIVRGWCPQSYIAKLTTLGVRIGTIEQTLSRLDALSLLASSDLSLMPCHSTPTMAFVEAMSRRLPTVTNDIWANREYLAEGDTGFLVPPPKGVRYLDENMTPQWYRPGFTESLRTNVDDEYLMRYVRVLSYLVEDENVLLSMKTKTSRYFANSAFDLGRRNRELGLLLDQALN